MLTVAERLIEMFMMVFGSLIFGIIFGFIVGVVLSADRLKEMENEVNRLGSMLNEYKRRERERRTER